MLQTSRAEMTRGRSETAGRKREEPSSHGLGMSGAKPRGRRRVDRKQLRKSQDEENRRARKQGNLKRPAATGTGAGGLAWRRGPERRSTDCHTGNTRLSRKGTKGGRKRKDKGDKNGGALDRSDSTAFSRRHVWRAQDFLGSCPRGGCEFHKGESARLSRKPEKHCTVATEQKKRKFARSRPSPASRSARCLVGAGTPAATSAGNRGWVRTAVWWDEFPQNEWNAGVPGQLSLGSLPGGKVQKNQADPERKRHETRWVTRETAEPQEQKKGVERRRDTRGSELRVLLFLKPERHSTTPAVRRTPPPALSNLRRIREIHRCLSELSALSRKTPLGPGSSVRRCVGRNLQVAFSAKSASCYRNVLHREHMSQSRRTGGDVRETWRWSVVAGSKTRGEQVQLHSGFVLLFTVRGSLRKNSLQGFDLEGSEGARNLR
ncbi:UNVERIFIED_CONTAM: hypothetical protein HHA_449180 [Hammondia hammondi]|eukprot:XP_008881745.1 hypothetical protein HHA_449180 [Hammondia hammondi]